MFLTPCKLSFMSLHPPKPHIILGVTGSVAAVKTAELCSSLLSLGEVRVIATDASKRFLKETLIPTSALPLLGDHDEWQSWKEVGDEVLHIELRRWADILVLAPLSANTLAKVSTGLCDNLLTCVLRAWDYQSGAPLVVAPAMNTMMWSHPLTAEQLEALQSFGAGVPGTVTVVPPVSKKLACGDVGVGAMAPVTEIVKAVEVALQALRLRRHRDMEGTELGEVQAAAAAAAPY
ncbi:hypothetical protein CEUSTIGMA_g6718.t1 [Chlamydomonas eustigma]|uniref:phosphopantothenoylcysteine decarboxylase n=1 Tax=Chlamydomonas eustigma TaxID=1157962 RepID=A0A250X869_9CHLO|nr:hypothetical protein CEUSTIGMA_g6718.t1 [Chlamydomonas eustigma]|eukprot:GAX79278.1 hypothetical protein CEUSTIGMA_g6718.t1 [Chlamydomonas eustigma]